MFPITAKVASLLMTSNRLLCALQFDYALRAYHDNLATLSSLVDQCPQGAIIVAPELCLSGYSYETMQRAAVFGQNALQHLKTLSLHKTLGLTLITQRQNHFFNTFMLFHKGECIYQQDKAKLFALGDETKYFEAGDTKAISVIEVDGLKIAILICFELRFATLWEQIKGADIIMVPSFWAKLRKNHFETLSSALAIMNQAYVICANSADEEMAQGSGIISPLGSATRDDLASIITAPFDIKEIKTTRRYLNIGLH